MKTFKDWQSEPGDSEAQDADAKNKPTDNKLVNESQDTGVKASARSQSDLPPSTEDLKSPRWRKEYANKDSNDSDNSLVFTVLTGIVVTFALAASGYLLYLILTQGPAGGAVDETPSFNLGIENATSESSLSLIPETTNDTSETSSPADEPVEEPISTAEITYYLAEIGTGGTRQLDLGEVETSCGDILVPQTLEIDAASAGEVDETLTLAMDEILDVTSESLSNPALSAEELESINVSSGDNSVMVDIVGDFDSVGSCEVERILTQIEQTAEVNADESEVLLMVNGSEAEFEALKLGE